MLVDPSQCERRQLLPTQPEATYPAYPQAGTHGTPPTLPCSVSQTPLSVQPGTLCNAPRGFAFVVEWLSWTCHSDGKPPGNIFQTRRGHTLSTLRLCAAP